MRTQAGCTRVEAERGEGLEDAVACGQFHSWRSLFSMVDGMDMASHYRA